MTVEELEKIPLVKKLLDKLNPSCDFKKCLAKSPITISVILKNPKSAILLLQSDITMMMYEFDDNLIHPFSIEVFLGKDYYLWLNSILEKYR